jgi:L-2-hydroxyglutarate oxidase
MSGYRRLIDFCDQESVQYQLCGKIVVATNSEQIQQLNELERRGKANGLSRMTRLNAAEIRDFEPHCAGSAGLHVPYTGIVDYVSVARAIRNRLESLGGRVLLNERVISLSETTTCARLLTSTNAFEATHVVTCGGLHSDRLAQHTISELNLRIIPFRGEYFKLREPAQQLVRNLIYPVPNPAFPFLGVHFTRTIDGSVECGPNAVLALSREGYKKSNLKAQDLFNTLTWPGFRSIAIRYWRTGLQETYRSFSKRAFVRALQALVPDISAGDLTSAPAGVRAQACDLQGNLLDDFAIRTSGRFTHICNAPSPAATASLAIGDYVAKQITAKLGDQ